jgi:anti-sigma factor RsiW
MTELRGQPSAGPAWGGGHLALDAIVAYVDEELSPGARRRALEHLARCVECAGEVVAQTQARWALRASAAPSLPSSLLSSLRAIPEQAELPGPPAGLAVGPDGDLVSMLREPHHGHRRWSFDRRIRLGAGAVVSGLALGALVAAADPSTPVTMPTASLSGVVPASGITQSVSDAGPALSVEPHHAAPAPAVLAPDGAAAPPSTEAAAVRHLH